MVLVEAAAPDVLWVSWPGRQRIAVTSPVRVRTPQVPRWKRRGVVRRLSTGERGIEALPEKRKESSISN
jgi:hypothetical protein